MFRLPCLKLPIAPDQAKNAKFDPQLARAATGGIAIHPSGISLKRFFHLAAQIGLLLRRHAPPANGANKFILLKCAFAKQF